jgi:hypothetical protein
MVVNDCACKNRIDDIDRQGGRYINKGSAYKGPLAAGQWRQPVEQTHKTQSEERYYRQTNRYWPSVYQHNFLPFFISSRLSLS